MNHAPWRMAGLCLLFIQILLADCNGIDPTDNDESEHKTLFFNLGNKVVLQTIWIDQLDLFVGKYEVSNRQFRSFDPKHTSGQHNQRNLDGDNQPVVNVSWNEAQAFCDWLSKSHGVIDAKRYEFRLPTEKEWETFAACGQNTEYPWGPNWPPPQDWNYFGRENREPGPKLDNDDGFRVSCPVQRSGQNRWGLFGVGGNVWEWCEDTDKASPVRVFKGASWSDCHPDFLKLSRRRSNTPDSRGMNRGFRVVASISEVGVEQQKRLEAGER